MNTAIEDLNNKPAGYYDNPRTDMMDFIPDGIRRTLEFGCGTGAFSYELKNEFGNETWAVEINPDAAESASEVIDKVINKDALEALTDLPDNYFDCVLFFDVLEHLIDPYTLLTEIKSKLTENGVVICSIPNIRYYRAFKSYLFGGDWEYKSHGVMDRTHLRFFTRKSIIATFHNLNYKLLKIEGLHPTSSRTYKLLNLLFLNFLNDVRYKHFVVVARPTGNEKC